MSLFKNKPVDSDEYLIRLDALDVALNFTSAIRGQRAAYTDREFLVVTDHVADYLRSGRIPQILGEATKAALRGKN